MQGVIERQLRVTGVGSTFDPKLFEDLAELFELYGSESSQMRFFAEYGRGAVTAQDVAAFKVGVATEERTLRAAHVYFIEEENDRWFHVWWRPGGSDFGSGASFQGRDPSELDRVAHAADEIFKRAAARADLQAPPVRRQRKWRSTAVAFASVVRAWVLAARV